MLHWLINPKMSSLSSLSRVASRCITGSGNLINISELHSQIAINGVGLISINRSPWKRLCSASEHTAICRESEVNFSNRVSEIVEEIADLTLLEVSDLTELLRQKLGVDQMPVMEVMMPGMGLRGHGAKQSSAAKAEEKVEKTVFNLKLESFDAAAKIKIIKEVRTFTDLGLKEAKDLVEKAPAVLKKGVSKEEADKIIEKMKQAGAQVVTE